MKSEKILRIVCLLCFLSVQYVYARGTRTTGIKVSLFNIQEDSTVTGNWSGTSICQQKNSGCHDEQAYYHISKTNSPLIYEVTGYKIVDNKKVNMGTLNFNYDISSHILTCTTQNGIFTFIIKGKNMEGELRTHDKMLFRKISLTRESI
jgi:hypothetical protein